jgi:ribosomal protein S12 methylthiotransferase accessory factor
MQACGATDILDVRSRLVSPLTGVVRKLHRVSKDLFEPPAPFIWRAEISNHLFAPKFDEKVTVASGKGLDEAAAMRSALGEAVERYSGLRFAADRCVSSARAELEGNVLEPELLVLHSDEQLEELGYGRYARDVPIAWIEGRRLNGDVAAWIPAAAVYLVSPPDSAVLFQPTSNGLAAGPTRDAARLRAVLEVVERDGFLAAWYHRLQVRPIIWRTHPDPAIRGLAESYERRGVQVETYLVPTDHGIPVVIGLAVEERSGGVAAVVGLGADRRLADAVRSAILEVAQVRPALRMKLRDPALLERREVLISDPSRVEDLEDHDLLYTDLRMLDAFDMWRRGGAEPVEIGQDNGGAVDDLGWVVDHLSRVGAQTYVCDVTPPDIASLNLHACRGFVENFQPIHFGERQFRKAGRRFYEIPVRLGLTPRPVAFEDLNPLPHPLA